MVSLPFWYVLRGRIGKHIIPFQTNGIFNKAICNKSGWPFVYIEESQVIISKNYCISYFEDQLCLSKQCRTR